MKNAAEAVTTVLQGKPEDTIPVALQTVVPEQAMSPAKTHIAIYDDVNTTIREQKQKKFEEFMNKLDTLAQLNEAIIHQNSTLISQKSPKRMRSWMGSCRRYTLKNQKQEKHAMQPNRSCQAN
ncbi:hypothetical protein GCM10020331_044100 [Ectobacillus funiculus]